MKIGSKVRVFHAGEAYSNYSEMYEQFGFPNDEWKNHCTNGSIGEVVGLKPHLDFGNMVACVKFHDGYVMIGVGGIVEIGVNPVAGYIQSQTRHTFARPYTKSGKPTRYLKILEYIKSFGPCPRAEILICLFDKNVQEQRSWYCGVFSGLNESGLLEYNHVTRKWQEGKKFRAYLQYAEYCKSKFK